MIHHSGEHPSAALWLLLGILPFILLCFYLLAAVRLRRTTRWSLWRLASFTVGTLVLAASVLPPLADWAHHDLRGHMLQHLCLGMFGPLGLVFGAPGSLLLRSVSAQRARGIMTILRIRPVRLLIHPVTAAFLDIGGMYHVSALSHPLLRPEYGEFPAVCSSSSAFCPLWLPVYLVGRRA